MEKNFKSLLVHFAKKKKLQQDQEKKTKTSKNQIEPTENKPKLKAKQPVKTIKQKKIYVKK